MRIRVSAWLGCAVALAACGIGRTASATAGTHAPAVSTYDTRASSIVFGYRHGFSDAGSFNTFSYNANFTSTTGRLSAQFGIHYVNFREADADARAHGVAGSGVAVLVFPVAGRYDNGVPKVGLAMHLGGVPTAFISGERNFLTLPLVLGFGVPLSPTKFLTFTPWYELAMSVNLDTVVKPEGVSIDPATTVEPDPNNPGKFRLKADAVRDALAQGVEIDIGVSVPMRVGLEASLHLGKSADLNLYGMLSTLGGAFSGETVKTVGGALVIRWDDIVPAVLPKPEVEATESCEATERRFRACPNARHWLSPEQRGQQPPSEPAPITPPPLTTAPQAPAPTPAPAPAPAIPAAPAAAPTTPAPTAPPQGSFPAP
jgi:hypothetical protein